MSDELNETENNDEAVMTDEQTPVVEDVDTPEDVQNVDGEFPETELDMEALKETIVRLKNEVETNLDGWQRSRAEFNNYRRRTQQQLLDSKQQGALDALSKMIPIMDDFERAVGSVPEELNDHPWVSGTSLILKNIQKVMDEYNVEAIDPVGEEFDPNLHEAIGTDSDSEYDSGIVSTTLQKGYKSGDKILRPALVRVAE